ncbi:MAG: hypothetical protein HQ514_09585 [Rhodospirillales bacterium]|nr:hypothetical protein [Rhodospirillales bacterium]
MLKISVGSRFFALVLMALLMPLAPSQANVWVKTGEVSTRSVPPRPMLESLDPDAPEIIVDSPVVQDKPFAAPVKVIVRFVAKSGTRILPDSVKLIYVTFFSDIDITDRVRDRITATGIRDEKAELPSGSHHLIVQVSDDKGRERKKEFRFEVE